MAIAKGRRMSLATRRLLSLNARGKRNPFYGKHHSLAWKKKESLSKRGKNNPMFGRHHTETTKNKIRAAAMRRLAELKAK
ncbi:MAG: NUMOD3 domain-containing DNA-binding protein [Candidatus Omnitrophica bacterium]|nr:NUMOD3 domain-containing DNA-binding protein [Candidatus Omnitrophota bacterium]